MKISFLIENFCLGAGLAMDAFSVSLANGLSEAKMHKKKALLIAMIFATFQGAMPLMGWFLVHSFVEHFIAFKPFIPWIALVLLLFIGGKMLYDGLHPCKEGDEVCILNKKLGFGTLLVQGVATSIDALSVGFAIEDYNFTHALLASFIIAAVTFVICFGGVEIGKRFGTKLSNKASVLGGVVLIFIGLEIFISSFI